MSATPIEDRFEADWMEQFNPEEIVRLRGDGTAQALELQRPVKPACPLCGMTGWHRESCPTQEKHT